MAAYGSDVEFNAWLVSAGLSLPSGSPTPAVLRERGSFYIDAVYGPRFKGRPTEPFTQELAWPRTGAVVFGHSIPPDMIPDAVVKASYRAAYLEATTPGGFGGGSFDPQRRLRRQKVNNLEREFFSPNSIDVNDPYTLFVLDPFIAGLLAPYLCDQVNELLGIWAVGP